MDLDLHSGAYASLSDRLQALHERIVQFAPTIDRVACAIYDSDDDMLKSFINSTRTGTALRAYQYRLSDSESLSSLARTRELRLLTDIQSTLKPTTQHSAYVLGEGYQSSFTVPLTHGDTFLGFLFFDSRANDAFTPEACRELLLYASIIAMAIANELVAVRSIIGTMHVAQSFAALRDVETGAHLDRMARYSRIITRNLSGPLGLSDEFIEQMSLYAPIHDVGKVAIPDAILLKPGPLTEEEFEVMKTHTTRGGEIVGQITADLGLESALDDQVLRNIVVLHHEKLDGSGYPYGLSGDEVPLEARIVTVADIFDAVTSPRPYKRPWSAAEGYEELASLARQGKLDRQVVAAFRESDDEVAQILRQHGEPQRPGSGETGG